MSTGNRARCPPSPTRRCDTRVSAGPITGGGSTATASRRCAGRTSRNQPTAPHSIATTPTIETRTWVTSPAPTSTIPNAVIMGHAVGAGTTIGPRSSAIALSPHHVHREEHDHPHAVHEVPVPGEQLGALDVPVVDVPPQRQDQDQADDGEPDRHVQRVQPDEGIERGAEEV